jgi:hypothetical protein
MFDTIPPHTAHLLFRCVFSKLNPNINAWIIIHDEIYKIMVWINNSNFLLESLTLTLNLLTEQSQFMLESRKLQINCPLQ